MDALTIMRHLHAAGVNLALRGDHLSAWPADRLDDSKRQLIRDHKPALVEFLQAAHETAAQVADAAMRACDHWSDGPEARQQMQRDVAATPPHLLPDLLEHLRRAYGGQQ